MVAEAEDLILRELPESDRSGPLAILGDILERDNLMGVPEVLAELKAHFAEWSQVTGTARNLIAQDVSEPDRSVFGHILADLQEKKDIAGARKFLSNLQEYLIYKDQRREIRSVDYYKRWVARTLDVSVSEVKYVGEMGGDYKTAFMVNGWLVRVDGTYPERMFRARILGRSEADIAAQANDDRRAPVIRDIPGVPMDIQELTLPFYNARETAIRHGAAHHNEDEEGLLKQFDNAAKATPLVIAALGHGYRNAGLVVRNDGYVYLLPLSLRIDSQYFPKEEELANALLAGEPVPIPYELVRQYVPAIKNFRPGKKPSGKTHSNFPDAGQGPRALDEWLGHRPPSETPSTSPSAPQHRETLAAA